MPLNKPPVDTYLRQLKEPLPGVLFSISQRELQACETAQLVELCQKLTSTPALARQHARCAELYFEGYEDDPRVIPEIPECRAWVSKLLQEWPPLLHILETDSALLAFNTVCPGHVRRQDGRIEFVSKSRQDFNETIERFLGALLVLHTERGFGEAEAAPIADDFMRGLGFKL
ncbi:hypothetical protein [Craterilacuibacter sp.]|uniref:hypothetical protein n=1 Tax=Craterilacuibacter sp. TaxID=2870909 RepID=UPI003F2F9A44